jgi:hypothetical protein
MEPVHFSRHALEQMRERGASEEEVLRAIAEGSSEPARGGRLIFRLNLEYNALWAGRRYAVKQVAPVVAAEAGRMTVVTVYTFYF